MGDQPKTCYEAGARADATDSHRLPGCGQARGPHQLLLIGLQAVMGGGSTTRLVLEILGSPYGRFFDRQVQHRIRHDSLVAVQLVGQLRYRSATPVPYHPIRHPVAVGTSLRQIPGRTRVEMPQRCVGGRGG